MDRDRNVWLYLTISPLQFLNLMNDSLISAFPSLSLTALTNKSTEYWDFLKMSGEKKLPAELIKIILKSRIRINTDIYLGNGTWRRSRSFDVSISAWPIRHCLFFSSEGRLGARLLHRRYSQICVSVFCLWLSFSVVKLVLRRYMLE